MTDNHTLSADVPNEMVSIPKRALCELELMLTRQIARAENAARAHRPEDAVRELTPLIANLRRLRSGVHRFTYQPSGVVTGPEHPGQEAARIFAELAFHSERMAHAIERLSQLDEAKGVVSWWRQ